MTKIISFLLIGILLSACAAVSESASTPVPLETPTASSKGACSPPSNWTIEYHRTGGIGGFDQALTLQDDGSLEVKSDHPPVDKQMTLPQDHVESIGDLLSQACPFEVGRSSNTCADCYNYELNIEMDGQKYVVQAVDTALPDDLRPLVETMDQFIQMLGQ